MSAAQIFDNYFSLKAYLGGHDEMRQVAEYAHQPQHKAGELYFGRWQVLWITVKAPFEYLISYVLSAIASILECMGTPTYARMFVVLSKQILRDQHHLEMQMRYGERLLVPAVNYYQTYCCEVYLNEDYPYSKIHDEKIRKLLLSDLKECRFSNLAFCRGEGIWFAYIHKHTAHLFKDPREHMIAVARLFEGGAPKQAAVLQAIDTDPAQLPELLDLDQKQVMNFTSQTLFDFRKDPPPVEPRPPDYIPPEVIDDKKALFARFDALEPALHMIYFPYHTIHYEAQTGLIWDSAHGLVDSYHEKEFLLNYMNGWLKGQYISQIRFLRC